MPLTQNQMDDAIPLFKKVPIFASLDGKSLGQIANSSVIETFDAGAKIATKGEEGTSFFLILDGAVEVRLSRRIVAKLGRGEFFGEMAILDEEPRSADVVAIEKTSCFAITRSSFKELIESNPAIGSGILKEVVRRLRKTTKTSFFPQWSSQ